MEEKFENYRRDGRLLSAEEYSAGGKSGRKNVIITCIIWGIMYTEAVIFLIKNAQYFKLLYYTIGVKIIEGIILFNLLYFVLVFILCVLRYGCSGLSEKKYLLFAPVSWFFIIDIVILGIHSWYYFYYFPAEYIQ